MCIFDDCCWWVGGLVVGWLEGGIWDNRKKREGEGEDGEMWELFHLCVFVSTARCCVRACLSIDAT